MRMKRLLLSLWFVAVSVVLSGCGGSQSDNNGSKVTFLDQAMTQAEIDALATGTPAYAMVEREDGIKLVPITLGARYTLGSSDYLTFKDSDRQFGSGDSGSPILNMEGKTIGALSGSFGGDNIVITPISTMISAVGSVSSASTSSAGIKNKLAWYATGVSPAGQEKLRNAGIPISDYDTRQVTKKAAKTAALADTTYALAPGRSMAVVPFDGPIVSLFAVGTVTHAIDADQMVAFGHSMNWDGQPTYSMPVFPAKIVQFVRDPVFGSFKLAVPVGSVQGGIVQDRSSAIMVSRTAKVEWVELKVNAGGTSTTHRACRLDNLNFQAQLMAVGLDGIVQGQLNIGSPGVFQTSIKITYSDNTTALIDLGSVDWSYYGGWMIWNYVAPELSRISKVEITLS